MELGVRRYFDQFLVDVLPNVIDRMIKAHDCSPTAHGGVERRVARVLWGMVGAAVMGGTSGGLISMVLGQ